MSFGLDELRSQRFMHDHDTKGADTWWRGQAGMLYWVLRVCVMFEQIGTRTTAVLPRLLSMYNAAFLIGLHLQRWLNAKPSFTGPSHLNRHLTSTYA